MAGADYLPCSHCSTKTIYDADVNYDVPNLGQIKALCSTCTDGGVRLLVCYPVPDPNPVTDQPTPGGTL